MSRIQVHMILAYIGRSDECEEMFQATKDFTTHQQPQIGWTVRCPGPNSIAGRVFEVDWDTAKPVVTFYTEKQTFHCENPDRTKAEHIAQLCRQNWACTTMKGERLHREPAGGSWLTAPGAAAARAAAAEAALVVPEDHAEKRPNMIIIDDPLHPSAEVQPSLEEQLTNYSETMRQRAEKNPLFLPTWTWTGPDGMCGVVTCDNIDFAIVKLKSALSQRVFPVPDIRPEDLTPFPTYHRSVRILPPAEKE